jgi:hypothetical protein
MVPEVPHKENFIHCIRTRERPNADIEEGHRSAALVHLGNIATRLDDRKLHFDAATESFPGDEQANRLLKRQNRTPFSIPGVV